MTAAFPDQMLACPFTVATMAPRGHRESFVKIYEILIPKSSIAAR